MTSQIIEEANRAYRNWGTILDPPIIFENEEKALASDLGNEYAGFDMQAHNLMINKQKIEKSLGKDLMGVILSHEVGHYALAPYDLENMIYLIRNAKQVLGEIGDAKYVENLFTDTVVNSFIFKNEPNNKQALIKLYSKMGGREGKIPDQWKLYLRSYEKLWNLKEGTIIKKVPADVEKAANSICKMMAPNSIDDVFKQSEWQDKIRRYAEIMKPFINEEKKDLKQQQNQSSQGANNPSNSAGSGSQPQQPPKSQGQGQSAPGQVAPGKGDAKKELGSGIIIHKHNPKTYKQDEKTFGKIAETIGNEEAKQIYAGLGLGEPGTLEDALINSLAEQYTIRLPKTFSERTGKRFIGYQKVDASGIARADIPYSVLTGGRILPGHNTFTPRFKESSMRFGVGTRIPDLAMALDTSSSMQGAAYYSVLAAKIAANSTLMAGGAVAVYNFSCKCTGQEQGFMRDKKKIYNLIELQQNGGTVFPASELIAGIRKHGEPQYLVVITDTGFINVADAVNALQQVDKYLVGGAFFLVNTSVPLYADLSKFNYDIIPVSDGNLAKEIQLKMKKVLKND